MGERFGGRSAGTPNKLTAKLRDMIEGALDDAGGRAYLATQAKESPAAFLNLVSKLIPRDLNVSGEVRHTLEDMILAGVQKRAAETRSESVQ